MKQPRSIRFHLSLVFFFFFLLVIVLGLFSIERLSGFNRVSADIRDRWLPNTRLIGDINNFPSDLPAAEGTNLLSSTTGEMVASEAEMRELDRSIAQAQSSYEKIPHELPESDLYADFKAKWTQYRSIVERVVALSPTDRKAEAVGTYMTTSRAAYDAASDALGRLTDRNVAEARAASDREDAAYREARWLIEVAMVLAGAMGAGALLYVTRSISNPLLDLASGMHRLAANDTAIKVQGTERRDEIGEMARAVVVFRSNAIELILSQRGLAQQASMLEEKLAHEQGLTQLQRNFVSMASHEFRTPLTIIDAHAQRLIKMSGRLRGEEVAERAGKIRGAVLRITNLIDTLLNSARLADREGKLYFHPTVMDVAVLLHDVCQLHRDIAPGSSIVESVGATSLKMVGDPKLLFQVLSNLIANAVKYSPGGGPIRVSAKIDSGEIVTIVEDRGVGIPQADIDKVFQRYYRGSNVSGIVGTGVGLYLVKVVVELHGGRVTAESREGEGARFTVRLPVEPPEPTPTLELAEGATGHHADAD